MQKKRLNKMKKIGEAIDKNYLLLKVDKKVFRFTSFTGVEDFVQGIFYGNISLKKSEEMQNKMELKIMNLENCNPRIQERKSSKKNP